MAAGQDRTGSSAYRPTSLDFINLPNPVQPALPSQKHPLNGTPHLEKARLETASTQDLIRLVLDASSGASSKRARPLENPNLDLPKLPVRNNAKRLRIPPTLSGLHQPPPDAGLLPSISIEQHVIPPPRSKQIDVFHDESHSSSTAVASPTAAPERGPPKESKKQSKKSAKRNKWTVEETEHLLKGVSRFGVGNWTKIKNCSDYRFNNRTALDLKDRFRVCFPDHKKPKNARSASQTGDYSSTDADEARTVSAPVQRGPASERVDTTTLQRLGINKPFARSERRARHGYSAAEDEALLRGFRKHGKTWTTIRQDPDLDLLARQATDLRDRMRTRFPEEYAKAGLAPRAKKQTPLIDEAENSVPENNAIAKTKNSKQGKVGSRGSTQHNATVTKSTEPRKAHQQALFSLDDVYLGRLSDDEDAEHEPITLDRGILDWATDAARPALAEISRPPEVNLPPMHAPDPPLSQGGQANGTTALPSLASLLPDSHSEHLELPSLTEWWGHNDGRPGGSSFPSLEDILSHDM